MYKDAFSAETEDGVVHLLRDSPFRVSCARVQCGWGPGRKLSDKIGRF